MHRSPIDFRAIRLTLLALLVTGMTAPPVSAEDCDDETCWLATTPNLTGDWWGLRPCLAETGVTFQADNTGFYFGNTAGGVNQDFSILR